MTAEAEGRCIRLTACGCRGSESVAGILCGGRRRPGTHVCSTRWTSENLNLLPRIKEPRANASVDEAPKDRFPIKIFEW